MGESVPAFDWSQTPAGPIKGSALRPEDRGQVETAHRNSLRLLKLINTPLDCSCIEAGRINASLAPTDLAVFTADLASQFHSAIQAAGLPGGRGPVWRLR
jgi:hypothetical protein